MRILKALFAVTSFAFLLYLLWPKSPTSINEFEKLPGSITSTLSGDTVEVPNIVAYYSNYYREYVVGFYRSDFQKLTGLPFPPMAISHPPEYAFTAIKDQTHSTYLVELTYPMRGTLFVNGLEPFDQKTKEPRYSAATLFEQDGNLNETKTTLRFYPTSFFLRIVVWLGINASVIAGYWVTKKVFIK